VTACLRSYGVDGPAVARQPSTRYEVGVRAIVDTI
jgi:hypothetical protein